MKRINCSHCLFSASTCVCSSIVKIYNETPVYIIQHPSEAKVAKGTAQLLNLSLVRVQVYLGESPDNFSDLKRTLKYLKNPVLIYPKQTASDKIWQTDHKEKSVKENPVDGLIAIDGTWRKSKKIYELNQWLHHIPKMELQEKGKYLIRASSLDHSLSTLEAVAYGLKATERLNIEPLLDLQQAMIENQMMYMPENVKKRYL